MPVTVPVPHAAYSSLVAQGVLDLSGCRCPQCRGELELTMTRVARTTYVLETSSSGCAVAALALRIALARCLGCGRRIRVLPCDLLPHKLYSLAVVEHSVSLCHRGDRSLRRALREGLSGERTPVPATLHAWTEGFGAYALGFPAGEVHDAVPASHFVAESERRFAPARAASREPIAIDPRRFRSDARRGRLMAGKRLLLIAIAVGIGAPLSLSHLNRLTLEWGPTGGLGFPTGLRSTAIEHPSPLSRPTSALETIRPPIDGRSPPPMA